MKVRAKIFATRAVAILAALAWIQGQAMAQTLPDSPSNTGSAQEGPPAIWDQNIDYSNTGTLGIGGDQANPTTGTINNDVTVTNDGSDAPGNPALINNEAGSTITNNGTIGNLLGATFSNLNGAQIDNNDPGMITNSASFVNEASSIANATPAAAEAALNNVYYDPGVIGSNAANDVTANLVLDTSFFSGLQLSALFGYAPSISSVPDSATWAMFGTGILGLGLYEIRRRRREGPIPVRAESRTGSDGPGRMAA
jgi:hypothetical protein